MIQADGNEETKHSFKCPDHGIFEASGYDNPVFLADTVANCPKCGEKCWNVRATTPAGVGQLESTQNALRNLYKAVQKSRAVNDPLGMMTAMEEAGKWF